MFDEPQKPNTPPAPPVNAPKPPLPPPPPFERKSGPVGPILSKPPVPEPPKLPVETPMPKAKNEPEDIFKEVDSGLVKSQPAGPVLGSSVLTSEEMKEPGFLARHKKWIILIVVVVVVIILAVVGYGVFWYPSQMVEPLPSTRIVPEETIAPEITTAPEIPEAEVEPEPTPSPDEFIDSDNDGLTNLEENELGTDTKKPDTDDDGLSDKEEVKIYNTDPLNPDTDGDTYLDGAEVLAGYNPKGPGKLADLQAEIEKLNQ